MDKIPLEYERKRPRKLGRHAGDFAGFAWCSLLLAVVVVLFIRGRHDAWFLLPGAILVLAAVISAIIGLTQAIQSLIQKPKRREMWAALIFNALIIVVPFLLCIIAAILLSSR